MTVLLCRFCKQVYRTTRIQTSWTVFNQLIYTNILMGAIHGGSNLSTTSRTLSMSFGFVKQHPPTKKGFKKHDTFFFTSLEARLECSLNPPKNKIELQYFLSKLAGKRPTWKSYFKKTFKNFTSHPICYSSYHFSSWNNFS